MNFTHRYIYVPAKRPEAHRLPILRVVCEYGVGLVIGRPAPKLFAPPETTPFVVILEDRNPAGGFGAFDPASLGAVLREVHGVAVLTGSLDPAPYALTASLLGQGVSTLIVETAPQHAQAWRRHVHDVAPVLPIVLLS